MSLWDGHVGDALHGLCHLSLAQVPGLVVLAGVLGLLTALAVWEMQFRVKEAEGRRGYKIRI